MRWSLGSLHANQLKLFHPPQSPPHWQALPAEVRQSAKKLLAQMLRRHAAAHSVPVDAKGASDE